jgi:hypothetical protein
VATRLVGSGGGAPLREWKGRDGESGREEGKGEAEEAAAAAVGAGRGGARSRLSGIWATNSNSYWV